VEVPQFWLSGEGPRQGTFRVRWPTGRRPSRTGYRQEASKIPGSR